MAALRSAEKQTDGADSAKVEGTTAMGALTSTMTTAPWTGRTACTGTMTITYTGGTMARRLRRWRATPMEARYLPDAYYANMGDGVRRAGRRQALDQVRLRRPGQAAGASGEVMKDQMQNSRPGAGVQLLLASGDVKKVGEETVTGRQATTHYAGTVDVAELAKMQSKDARRSDLSGAEEAVGDLGIDDRDGRHLGRR